MVVDESGSGSLTLTNGSGSGRPKNMWIRIRIRIRNTNSNISQHGCRSDWNSHQLRIRILMILILISAVFFYSAHEKTIKIVKIKQMKCVFNWRCLKLGYKYTGILIQIQISRIHMDPYPVLRIRIRIHRIHMVLDLLDPELDPSVRGMDPDPDPDLDLDHSITMQKK
jgi:hypothetical protein